MIKLIFSDMDGTLLDENGKVPEEFDDLMAELKKRNVRFVPASGRQYHSLVKSFEKHRDSMIFMAENGNMVRDGKGTELYSNVMDREVCRRIWNKSLSLPGIYPVACAKKASYILPHWEKYLDECKKYFSKYEFIESFDDIDDEIVKIALADNHNWQAEKNIYHSFDEFKPEMQVSLSSDLWVDLTNNGANKGESIKHLIAKLGIGFDECAAFGDFLNDYEMMSAVYYSFAMENAHPRLKEVARFRAKSNAELGVIKAIYDLIEQGLI